MLQLAPLSPIYVYFILTYHYNLIINDVSLKRCELHDTLGTPVLGMSSQISEAWAVNK